MRPRNPESARVTALRMAEGEPDFAETIPDDEDMITASNGFETGAINSSPVDMTWLLRSYGLGVVLFVGLLLLNYLSWRHYSASIKYVLTETPNDLTAPNQASAGRGTPREREREREKEARTDR